MNSNQHFDIDALITRSVNDAFENDTLSLKNLTHYPIPLQNRIVEAIAQRLLEDAKNSKQIIKLYLAEIYLSQKATQLFAKALKINPHIQFLVLNDCTFDYIASPIALIYALKDNPQVEVSFTFEKVKERTWNCELIRKEVSDQFSECVNSLKERLILDSGLANHAKQETSLVTEHKGQTLQQQPKIKNKPRQKKASYGLFKRLEISDERARLTKEKLDRDTARLKQHIKKIQKEREKKSEAAEKRRKENRIRFLSPRKKDKGGATIQQGKYKI